MAILGLGFERSSALSPQNMRKIEKSKDQRGKKPNSEARLLLLKGGQPSGQDLGVSGAPVSLASATSRPVRQLSSRSERAAMGQVCSSKNKCISGLRRLFPALCGDCAVCIRQLTCGLCAIRPEKRVFLVGRKGSGKTSILYHLNLGVSFEEPKAPTRGHNYEVITFSPFKAYEFVDPGGSSAQEPLWELYYQTVKFDYIVYVISVDSFLRCKEEDRLGYFKDDRDNILSILAHEKQTGAKAAESAKVLIYLNFNTEMKESKREVLRAFIVDELALHKDAENPDKLFIPAKNIVDSVFQRVREGRQSLCDAIDVDTSPTGDQWVTCCYTNGYKNF